MRWTFWLVCDSLFIGEGFREGKALPLELIGGWRMTGSAYQAMDVLGTCDSLYRVGVWGRDYTKIFLHSRLADLCKSIKINESLIGKIQKKSGKNPNKNPVTFLLENHKQNIKKLKKGLLDLSYT